MHRVVGARSSRPICGLEVTVGEILSPLRHDAWQIAGEQTGLAQEQNGFIQEQEELAEEGNGFIQQQTGLAEKANGFT